LRRKTIGGEHTHYFVEVCFGVIKRYDYPLFLRVSSDSGYSLYIKDDTPYRLCRVRSVTGRDLQFHGLHGGREAMGEKEEHKHSDRNGQSTTFPHHILSRINTDCYCRGSSVRGAPDFCFPVGTTLSRISLAISLMAIKSACIGLQPCQNVKSGFA
jgi:hypothetical protein